MQNAAHRWTQINTDEMQKRRIAFSQLVHHLHLHLNLSVRIFVNLWAVFGICLLRVSLCSRCLRGLHFSLFEFFAAPRG